MTLSPPEKTLDGHGFLNVLSRAEFCALLSAFAPLGRESVTLSLALGRVLAGDLPAPEDLPPTARACMAASSTALWAVPTKQSLTSRLSSLASENNVRQSRSRR